MPFVSSRVYPATGDPVELTSLAASLAAEQAPGLVTLVLSDPSEEELREVADAFSLNRLAVEDALHGHQRAKLERYDDTLFVVLRPARYDDASETVVFGELHAFVGADFVVSVVRSLPDPTMIDRIHRRFVRTPHAREVGAQGLLWAAADVVVDSYAPVDEGLQEDIDQIENQLFEGQSGVSRRIYELFGEVLEFQRATRPLLGMLDNLLRGADKYGVPAELRDLLGDVRDHVIRTVERVDAFRSLLQNALTVDSTIAAQKQNDDTKKISGWAAILFAPTLIAAIYGMNFRFMPELDWRYGYPAALLAMFVFGFALWLFFKARHWF